METLERNSMVKISSQEGHWEDKCLRQDGGYIDTATRDTYHNYVGGTTPATTLSISLGETYVCNANKVKV